jgi:hypothetical protein
VSSLLGKMGVSSRAEAAEQAVRLRLVEDLPNRPAGEAGRR